MSLATEKSRASLLFALSLLIVLVMKSISRNWKTSEELFEMLWLSLAEQRSMNSKQNFTLHLV